MRIPLARAASLLVLFGLTLIVNGEDKPAAAPPAENAGVTIGEMRIQTVPALAYLYTTAETSFDKMTEPVVSAFGKIVPVARQGKMLFAHPTLLVYQDSPHYAPRKPFKMEIGLIVEAEAQLPDGADADIKIRKTEPFKCATVLYTGPVMQQGKAYEKLIPAIKAAGLTPTGEERELCLYWEGMDSPNNVFHIQIGIK